MEFFFLTAVYNFKLSSLGSENKKNHFIRFYCSACSTKVLIKKIKKSS